MNQPLFIIGIIAIVLGVFAGIYTQNETNIFGMIIVQTKPFRDWTEPLIVAGIVLIAVGYFTRKKKPE